MLHRRKFLQHSSTLIGSGLVASAMGNSAFGAFKKISPGDQINVAAIGINGMGWTDLTAASKVPGVNVVALCDVDKNVLDKRMNDLKAMNIDASKVKTYSDYRKLLEQKDIDAVIIGTPDHWHALIMTEAAAAGKDVYCEKPVGNSIEECRVMQKAQQKYNRVVQVGQWQRSQQHFKNAVDYVRSGQLGNIRTVKGLVLPGLDAPRTYCSRHCTTSRCGLCHVAGARAHKAFQQQPLSF